MSMLWIERVINDTQETVRLYNNDSRTPSNENGYQFQNYEEMTFAPGLSIGMSGFALPWASGFLKYVSPHGAFDYFISPGSDTLDHVHRRHSNGATEPHPVLRTPRISAYCAWSVHEDETKEACLHARVQG